MSHSPNLSSLQRVSINGNHTLRDGPKRRDLLRVSGNHLSKTTTEPLALRSRLSLAASRRAPAGENRQSLREREREAYPCVLALVLLILGILSGAARAAEPTEPSPRTTFYHANALYKDGQYATAA